MAKNNRSGKATIFEDSQYQRLIRATEDPRWRLFFQIAWHTGERCGAIAQLKVSDVFDSMGSPLNQITYRAETRKRAAGRAAETRQVFVNATLKAILTAYGRPNREYLFVGGFDDRPIRPRSVQSAMARYLEKAGLGYGGFSSHSFRRTFITRLANTGVNVRVIQKITGHKDLDSLAGYIEVGDEQIKGAMNAIA